MRPAASSTHAAESFGPTTSTPAAVVARFICPLNLHPKLPSATDSVKLAVGHAPRSARPLGSFSNFTCRSHRSLRTASSADRRRRSEPGSAQRPRRPGQSEALKASDGQGRARRDGLRDRGTGRKASRRRLLAVTVRTDSAAGFTSTCAPRKPRPSFSTRTISRNRRNACLHQRSATAQRYPISMSRAARVARHVDPPATYPPQSLQPAFMPRKSPARGAAGPAPRPVRWPAANPLPPA